MQQFSLGQAVATESCQLDVQWPGRTSLGTDQSGDRPAWGRASLGTGQPGDGPWVLRLVVPIAMSPAAQV